MRMKNEKSCVTIVFNKFSTLEKKSYKIQMLKLPVLKVRLIIDLKNCEKSGRSDKRYF